MCRTVKRSSSSHKPSLTHVLLIAIAWTPVHAIDALRSDPTPVMPPRCLQKEISPEVSPTRRKWAKILRLRAWAV